MKPDKVNEFLTVLIFAMAVGAAAMLSILYLNGIWRDVTIVALIVVSVISWQFLRRRYGRAK